MSERGANVSAAARNEIAIETRKLSLWYGTFQALFDVDLEIRQGIITSMIGPSGCGKSTYLRCINRMNDVIPIARVTGTIEVDGQDIYDPALDVVELRARVGMVFQKPNPFPKSIYENVAFGARINGYKGDMDELVRKSLEQAALCGDLTLDPLDAVELGSGGYAHLGGDDDLLVNQVAPLGIWILVGILGVGPKNETARRLRFGLAVAEYDEAHGLARLERRRDELPPGRLRTLLDLVPIARAGRQSLDQDRVVDRHRTVLGQRQAGVGDDGVRTPTD